MLVLRQYFINSCTGLYSISDALSYSMLSDAAGELKGNIGEIDLLCTNSDFDVFQKSDNMCQSIQTTLSQRYDHHPQVSDGAVFNFDDQSAFVSNIMAYGSVQTGKCYPCILCC